MPQPIDIGLTEANRDTSNLPAQTAAALSQPFQIVKPADYVQEQSPVVKAQLSKAALRLATLLNLVLDQPTPAVSSTPTPTAAATATPTPTTPTPSTTPAAIGDQWEYQMTSAASATDLLTQANTQGTQGWQLTTVVIDTKRSDKYVGFLKRKKP